MFQKTGGNFGEKIKLFEKNPKHRPIQISNRKVEKRERVKIQEEEKEEEEKESLEK